MLPIFWKKRKNSINQAIHTDCSCVYTSGVIFFLNFSIWNVINSNLSMREEYTHNITQRKKQHKVIKWKKNVELGELRWRMRCFQYTHVLFLPNSYYFLIISLESKTNWRMMRKHTKWKHTPTQYTVLHSIGTNIKYILLHNTLWVEWMFVFFPSSLLPFSWKKTIFFSSFHTLWNMM